jgi:hypothetical protein
VLYAASNVLTDSVSREGYQLMQLLRSYLELDSLTGLDAHTEKTLEMIENELLVFGNELKVCMDFVTIPTEASDFYSIITIT